jgi:hypothetical protein
METNNFQIKQRRVGVVRAIPEKAEETRIIPFILSSSGRDRHGTILSIEAWSLDNYRNNPIVGYMHEIYGSRFSESDPDSVIGKNVGIKFEGDKEKLMIGDTHFEPGEVNLKAEKIFRKILFQSLRAVSVGFEPLGKGSWGKGAEAIDGENPTYYFAGQELLEYSIVTIPSNPDAVQRHVSENAAAAINYALQQLGGKFRQGKIKEMRVKDLLTFLDGKDIDIRESDPDKIRKMLSEREAIDDLRQIFRDQAEKRNELADLMDYYKQCSEIIADALSHPKNKDESGVRESDNDLILLTRSKLALNKG